MTDSIVTGLLLILVACGTVYKAKYHPQGNPVFFDQENTKVMRAIWAVIVVLVHIPPEFRNSIQDLAGSFAYIGVTSFFMFSGYGLMLSLQRKHSMKGFWPRKLVNLFVPQLFSNIIAAVLMFLLLGERPDIGSVLWIARWIRWLLMCYLIFWLTNSFIKDHKISTIVNSSAVILISLLMYGLNKLGYITQTIWPTEIYGFIWGILLAIQMNRVKKYVIKWKELLCIAFVASLVLGIGYLKYKYVDFWGDYVLKIVLGCAILSFVLLLNMKFSLGNRIMGALGNISYEIYLIHTVIISILSEVMKDVSSCVFIVAVFAVTLTVASLIHFLTKCVKDKILMWI